MSSHIPSPGTTIEATHDHIDDIVRSIATCAVSQGWTYPTTQHLEFDPVLAEALCQSFVFHFKAWYDTCVMHHNNERYYRGLIQQVGAMFGPDTYTNDVGEVYDEVLCAKVPGVVRDWLAQWKSAQSPPARQPWTVPVPPWQQGIGGF